MRRGVPLQTFQLIDRINSVDKSTDDFQQIYLRFFTIFHNRTLRLKKFYFMLTYKNTCRNSSKHTNVRVTRASCFFVRILTYRVHPRYLTVESPVMVENNKILKH